MVCPPIEKITRYLHLNVQGGVRARKYYLHFASAQVWIQNRKNPAVMYSTFKFTTFFRFQLTRQNGLPHGSWDNPVEFNFNVFACDI